MRDDAVRDLLTRLAAAEDKHEKLARELGEEIPPNGLRSPTRWIKGAACLRRR
jgi:rubrerythrin